MIYYLFIACFDQKIGVFQQTVVRLHYILKRLNYFKIYDCFCNSGSSYIKTTTKRPYLFLFTIIAVP